MRDTIVNSHLNKELKNKLVVLFDNVEEYVNYNIAETNYTTRKIYTPIEIMYKDKKVVRVGIVNDNFFGDYKDLKIGSVEFEKEDFNFFDNSGKLEGLLPLDTSLEKAIIFMPGIHIPAREDGDTDIFKTVDYSIFFN